MNQKSTDGLRGKFASRAAAIEKILREKKVGSQSLNAVRATDEWRTTLLGALRSEQHSTVDPDTVRRIEYDDTGATREGWNLERLISQHLILGALERQCREPSEKKIDFKEWRKWAHNQGLMFYDATALELLGGRVVLGDAAVIAYHESLKAAESEDASDGTVADGDGALAEELAARREMAQKLREATSATRADVLWGFIGSTKSILAAYDSVYKEDERKLSWLLRLARLMSEVLAELMPDQGAERASLMAALTIIATEADWLLDPGRLTSIAEAAHYIDIAARERSQPAKVQGAKGANPTGPGPAATPNAPRQAASASSAGDVPPKGDAERLDVLEQTRQRFVAQSTRVLHARTLCRRSAHPVPAGSRELWSYAALESILDDVWWASFGESADAVAAFCRGQRHASWRSHRVDEATARLQTIVVGARDRRDSTPSGEERLRAHDGPPSVQEADDSHRRAIVFGAGIAGLTAAHELAERGFKVVVIEAARELRTKHRDGKASKPAPAAGGLARTQWAEADAAPRKAEDGPGFAPTGAPANVVSYARGGETVLFPGEHGYRLFPSFYRHVFDTMKRTPIFGAPHGLHPTAFDQLQPTHRQVFARRGEFVHLSRSRPRSVEAFRKEYLSLVQGLGFDKRDLTRFFFKLLRYLMTCSERRASEYERMTMLEFFGADLYSKPFQQMLQATPKALVAMDAARCDARTQGNVYLQLLLDQVLGGDYTDSTLRGPTTTAWFDDWVDYLQKSFGVTFVNAELLSIHPTEAPSLDSSSKSAFKIELKYPPGEAEALGSARVLEAEEHDAYIVIALDAVATERVTAAWNGSGVPRELRGFTSTVLVDLPANVERCEVALVLREAVSREQADLLLRELLALITSAKDDELDDPMIRSVFRALTNATGWIDRAADTIEELRIALWFMNRIGPVEVKVVESALLKWVDGGGRIRFISREPAWSATPATVETRRMPDEIYGTTARDRFQTFTGVQFYFAQDFKLVDGHVYFPDTEWGLSAVSQSQFWLGNNLPRIGGHQIRGVLSVDIGDCTRPSSYLRKSLLEASPLEIAKEVWRQIEDSLRSTRGPSAIVTNLPLPVPLYFHVDENLVFGGKALSENLTPFLINNVGDWDRRPRCQPWVPGRHKEVAVPRTDSPGVWQSAHGGYRVHGGRVVFCGTYMRTFTRMTTMEAANESARHAVNAILDYLAEHDGGGRGAISGDYCAVWDLEQHELEDLEMWKRVDKMLFEANKPHVADILQFDRMADLDNPQATPAQSLVASLGSVLARDWGIGPLEVAGAGSGVMELGRLLGKDLGRVAALGESPLRPLLDLLGPLLRPSADKK